MLRKKALLCLLLCSFIPPSFAGHLSLDDWRKPLWEMKVLEGEVERPAWSFKSLSTLVFEKSDSPWEFYDIAWFNSYNSTAPYGINDGGLWQGKGYNTSVTAGLSFQSKHAFLSFKPRLSFSQNLPYHYTTPSSLLSGQGSIYGYYDGMVDAPQRFGDKPYFDWDWGDSVIRLSYGNLSIGFGTEYLWLGPAFLNPLIHSNNAPGYPHLDIGLTKTTLRLPWLGWYAGEIEARVWWGYLSESKYFDDNPGNDHNLIAGSSFSWTWHDFSIAFNRIMISRWDNKNAYTLGTVLNPPFIEVFGSGGTSGGRDKSDQRISLAFDYLIPKVGLELYLEIGKDDYSPSINWYLRYPFHTIAYTIGGRKRVTFSKKFKGEFIVEVSTLETSTDYLLVGDGTSWSSFYQHGYITQGHTNKGQWLGAGIGTGGNSQYAAFRLYNPEGYTDFFIWRQNPDLGASFRYGKRDLENGEEHIRANLHFGIETYQQINRHFALGVGGVYTYEWNPTNGESDDGFWRRCNLTGKALLVYSW